MDIHKAKPIHSWRQFLKEYAIIVIGVLTALGAEQAVEWVHWQGEVKIARQSIRREILNDNINLFSRRVALAPCTDRLADQAGAIISALQAGRKAQSLTGFRAGLHGLIADSEWQSERASQVLTHFPRKELALMGGYYAQFLNFEDWLTAEGMAWQELSVLQDVPMGLSTSDIVKLKVNLSIARRMEFLTERNARRELGLSRELGVPEANPGADFVAAYCGRMSQEDFRRWQNARGAQL
jgi:hypothetical protein